MVVPLALKKTVMCSLLKVPFLDPTSPKSFCPVSSLPFWEKVMKKVNAWQLQRTLNEAYYMDPFQSRYRLGYKTEITVIALRLPLVGVECGSISIILLDLSTDFNITDQSWSPSGLASGFRDGSTMMCCFSSFLRVAIGERDSWTLLCVVLRGLFLSHLLFNIYMKLLGDMIQQVGVRF